jgi:hypothetical protein
MSNRIFAWALLVLLPSCATRTLLVETTPPGAEVILNRKSVGSTPVSVPFLYGGINEILLLPPAPNDGLAWRAVRLEYDSNRTMHDFPFLDLPADLVGTVDEHHVHVELPVEDVAARYEADPYRDRPSVLPPLLQRADTLRSRTRALFLSATPREPLLPTEQPETIGAGRADR